MPAPKGGKKKVMNVKDLSQEQQLLFTGKDGSDTKEWTAWLTKEACDVLDMKQRGDPTLSCLRVGCGPTSTTAEFLAKSRLVIPGFKDRSLGYYRRDAPTASAIAESTRLAVATCHHLVLTTKDVKNAYFSGKNVGRSVPRAT